MSQVIDNAAAGRFELEEQGALAYADYRRTADGRLVLPHVEAAPSLRGTGAAGRLMEGVLAIARADGLKVVPLCGYAAAYIRRHPEHNDLTA
jgi:predicted GNAT family acetyltransferase